MGKLTPPLLYVALVCAIFLSWTWVLDSGTVIVVDARPTRGGKGRRSRRQQGREEPRPNRGRRRRRAPNFKSAGIALSKQGDLEGAIKSFRKAIVQNPTDAAGYNNLGVALMRQGLEDDSVKLLNEAYHAFSTAQDEGGRPDTDENIATVLQYLKQRGAHVSSEATMEVGEDGETSEVAKADSHERLRQRILSGCQKHKIRLKVKEQDHERGHLSGGTINRAASILELCGVVVLERLFTPEFMDTMKTAQAEVVDTFLSGIEENPALTNSTWSEQRSPGRYELLSPMKPPFTDSELVANPLLLPLMQRSLGTSRIEVDTHSSVTSLGNTPAQHWHRDAGFIFSGDVLDAQLPPHGLVVFVPLIDVDMSMGPTQFLTGSHIACKSSDYVEVNLNNWILRECPFVGPPVPTPAPKGSAVIFDLRILHRGLANTVSSPISSCALWEGTFLFSSDCLPLFRVSCNRRNPCDDLCYMSPSFTSGMWTMSTSTRSRPPILTGFRCTSARSCPASTLVTTFCNSRRS